MRQTLRDMLAPLTLCLLTALSAAAPAAAQDMRLPDETIRQVVENRLQQRGLDGAVEVEVEEGVVILTGTVESIAHRVKIAELARGVDDVERVDNRLQVRAGTPGDEDLATQIGRKIRNDAFFGVFDWIDGRVEGNRVILQGAVREAWKKEHFGDLVGSVGGVEEVVNEIEILPASVTDDRIRESLVRQIYGDPAFFGRGVGSLEPIHIIVRNSRVRLEGVVNSEVEKRIAASAARNSMLVFDVENNLVVQ